MGYALLTLEKDARGVAFVTLNRPEVHNAFDAALIAELTAVFAALAQDTTVRLAVLAGAGKSFCAGGDLHWMRSMKNFSREENIADSQGLAAMYARLHDFPKPLIGVVHGAALGGGSGLAAVCDFVVASADARFGFTETRLGILPAVIGPYAMEKIGISAARAYFISGMQFSAETAKDIGLVHRVVAAETLAAARDETIAEFLRAAPGASANAKALIDRIVSLKGDRKAITDATIDAIVSARISDEGQEGMDALLTKRRAAWVNV
ncbi:MAG: enoyl-CoA hydratase-related protein [Alphaproteobacteria bacterium]|nr:enoyl-CoA hydratase-related protein [Alphaproteobacteria bacterium]